jgi:hypothetical protein
MQIEIIRYYFTPVRLGKNLKKMWMNILEIKTHAVTTDFGEQLAKR